MRRRIDPDQGMSLIRAYAVGTELSTADKRHAVRFALEEFAARHPGQSVEIRIPWVGAVQAIEGPVHTRGTPPNLVEMDGDTFLTLATGGLAKPGAISYSGTRANLAKYFPLFGSAELAG